MPASDYEWDPDGALAANAITGEVFALNTSVTRAVFTQAGPFFKDTLVVRGRNGLQPWEELGELEHFFFSPPFLEMEQIVGREVFSYIVIMGSYTEISLDYRAVGEYTDNKLAAHIVQLDSDGFDRSNIRAWRDVRGPAEYYHPRVRDPGIIDRNWMEVLNVGLNEIRTALQNPNTSTPQNFDQLITEIQNQIALAATKAELLGLSGVMDTQTAVAAGTDGIVYTLPAAGTFLNFEIAFYPDIGTGAEIMQCLLANDNGTYRLTRYNQMLLGANTRYTLDVREDGTNLQILARPTVDGVFRLKTLYRA